MKVSLNWLKQYLDIPLSATETAALLTDIGLEVEGMEEVESIQGGLAGVVVGEVLTCDKHPNADKLSLTTVHIGDENPLSIVCGAPNVAAGQKVLVAKVGTTLYPSDGDPITLKQSKIRGELSQGMICAEDELGLGQDHSGILVLPADTPVGLAAATYFDLASDTVFDVNLTPNRSDATCHLGVARDLYAGLTVHHNYKGQLKWPSVDGFKSALSAKPMKVDIVDKELCPRYSGIILKNIQIAESPEWLKLKLKAVGVRPINNVVDITNYVLHELGQPLHAFDLRAIPEGRITVRTLPEGTTITTLDTQERKLNGEELIICGGDHNPMCIGGVFGGLHSGIQPDTTEIFLESAHFQAKSIRRTSMRHNLRTDAAKVFEKGSDPEITVFALKRAALLLQELANAEIASEITDIYEKPTPAVNIDLYFDYVRELTGAPITDKEMIHILSLLDMVPIFQDEEKCRVSVPKNKSDVLRPADLVEEILRIYGFNRVSFPDAMRTTLSSAPKPDRNQLNNQISELLTGIGFSEMMGVSLSQSAYYKADNWQIKEEELVFINNTSHALLDIMRPEMAVSGLEVILHNQNRQQHSLKLFEWGKTYLQTPEGIKETNELTLFIAGDRNMENWKYPGQIKTSFFTLKGVVVSVLSRLGITNLEEEVFQQAFPFDYGLHLKQGNKTYASFGKLNAKLTQSFSLREEIFYAQFNWDFCLQKTVNQKIKFKEISKFPSIRRDLALIVDNSIKFSDIVNIAKKAGKKQIVQINLFDVYENEKQLGKGKRSYAVSYTFENLEKTLQDKEVDAIIENLLTAYQSELGAYLRK
ncbi:MAG: phenylalanine--tRNA ligase subunit beta [Bacteroidetes bacterium]|nr:phenylalanine--tRNA ligase subunit beta [Bacteroidota bacterium]